MMYILRLLSAALLIGHGLIMAQDNRVEPRALKNLYHKFYARPARKIMQRRTPTKLSGIWANSSISKKTIPTFVKKYKINVDEIANPLESFRTFNQFFTRKLKPEARPIAKNPQAIISPADGKILAIPHLNKKSQFPIKGVSFSPDEIFQNAEFAKQFQDGTAIIVRLAPWDYHRVHFPLSGIPGKPRLISGAFHSVSPTVFHANIQPIEQNERLIIPFKSDKAGFMALVMVGAMLVGKIIHTYTPYRQYQQGDEIGYYEYGASTIVLFFKKNTVRINCTILSQSKKGIETPIKMGESIGTVSL